MSSLPEEECEASWPSKYVLAPANVLDWTQNPADTFPILNHAPPPATPGAYNTTTSRAGSPGSTIGANEGRLIEPLRKVAQRQDAMAALCDAAKAFAAPADGIAVRIASRIGRTERVWNLVTNLAMAKATADLAVTGKHTFERFRTDNPSLESLKRACPGVADASLNRALDRAYSVANAIRVRGTDAQPTAERKDLGWIAVSGEDDKPYRPVNVPSAPFPQFDVDVDVRGMAATLNTIHTRYMIAHARPPRFPQRPVLARGDTREVKGDVEATIAPDAEVIIFVHGMDSRIEEALNLTGALHKLAAEPGGKNWTILAFDMPTSGYADSIDHHLFGPAGNVTCHQTPLVDFLENYVVKFVDAVDAQVGGRLKPRIRAVVGGSLGGSMSLRLGRREALGTQPPAPWIHNVVPWSPASIWPPITNRGGLAAGCDGGWNAENDVAIGWPRGMAEVNERPNDRRNFFYGGFDYNPPTLRAQSWYWYREGWKCKSSNIVGARVDRHETYDALFRRYHWRLAAEQLAFSHRQNRGPDPTRPALSDPLFLHNRTRTLLLAGEDDTGGALGWWTNQTAPLMMNTPGLFRFLRQTGHSLDDERPMWVAKEIVNFLASDPHTPLPPARPSNDDFATATVLSVLPVEVPGTTMNATREASEPDHYTENKPDAGWWLGDHSVWYQWTAPGSGPVTVDVCTGAIDSIVAVYSGSTLGSLSRIVDNNNDNCGGGWGAKVTFAASPGVRYHIAVSDAGGARENTFILRLSGPVPVTACGNGIVESGERCDDGNSFSFDRCSPDCQHACSAGTVWCDCKSEHCTTKTVCDRECGQ